MLITKKRLLSSRSLRGDSGIRTHDLLHAMQALSQLSYTPISSRITHTRLLYTTIRIQKNQVVFKIFCNCSGRRENRAKTGVKLAYKHAFAPVFTSEEPPMPLVRPLAGQEDAVLNSYYLIDCGRPGRRLTTSAVRGTAYTSFRSRRGRGRWGKSSAPPASWGRWGRNCPC